MSPNIRTMSSKHGNQPLVSTKESQVCFNLTLVSEITSFDVEKTLDFMFCSLELCRLMLKRMVLVHYSREPPLLLWGKHLTWIHLSQRIIPFRCGEDTIFFMLAHMIQVHFYRSITFFQVGKDTRFYVCLHDVNSKYVSKKGRKKEEGTNVQSEL